MSAGATPSPPADGDPRSDRGPAVTTRAPAKINLGLRVRARRDDGYHELESLLLPLDLEDEVRVERRAEPGIELVLDGAAGGVPADERNLAVRAARSFLEAAGLQSGVAIRLSKTIPAAAGLGGGSSDAAAVLRALARLFPGALPAQRLPALALTLGTDVPFFLDPRPARVAGIGEHIESVAGLPSLPVLLVNPGIPLATADVYRALDALGSALTRPELEPTMRPLSRLGDLRRIDPGGARLLEALAANDLEPAATRLCPPIARLRARLRALGALAVGMSGSGPTLFGVFEDRDAAAAAQRRADFHAPVWSRVAATLRSP